MGGGHDVGFADDSLQWRYKKKHMMRAMKQISDGVKDLEAVTLKFGVEMIHKMESYCNQAFNPYGHLRMTIGSLILALIYGESTQDYVEKINNLDKRFSAMMRPNSPNILLDVFPFLRFFSTGLGARYSEALSIGQGYEEICRSLTNSRKTHRETNNSKIFIDYFLDLLVNGSDQSSDRNMKLNDRTIIFMGVDLLVAGIETNSFFLTNLLGILVNHQKIQDQAYEEITKVICKRAPMIEDRQHLPFIEALVLETLRYTGMTPLALPHYSSCDTDVDGFFVPKGTIVFPNLWSLHHNEKYWDNPFEFDPQRFIENGELVPPDHVKRQRLMPFSAGRRQCVGEAVSRNRLFILVTLLLQRFKFLPAEGHPRPQHDPREYVVGINNLIKPYHLVAHARD